MNISKRDYKDKKPADAIENLERLAMFALVLAIGSVVVLCWALATSGFDCAKELLLLFGN